MYRTLKKKGWTNWFQIRYSVDGLIKRLESEKRAGRILDYQISYYQIS